MKKYFIYLPVVFLLLIYSNTLAQKHVRVRVHIIDDCITEQTAQNEIHKLNTNYYAGSGIVFMLDHINYINNT